MATGRASGHKISAPWNVLCFNSSSFTAVPSRLRRHGGMVLKGMYGDVESRGNWLTQVEEEEDFLIDNEFYC